MPLTPSSSKGVTGVVAPQGRPLGLSWRSSYWFITYVVGLGIAVDVVTYSIIIPVVPFQLQRLGYTGISALTGWLLFAYSGGLLFATIPIAMWSELYNARRYPMVAGILALIGSQIAFMEAPTYAVVCAARVFQGISSAVVWTIGLAFLCDATPPEIIGRQIGIAMSGLSFGLVLGPPIGGVIYSHFGFRGPFICSLVATFIDTVSRLVAIEPKEAAKWGADPTVRSKRERHTIPASEEPKAGKPLVPEIGVDLEEGQPIHQPHINIRTSEEKTSDNTKRPVGRPLSLFRVIAELSKSSRALVALAIAFVYGFVYSSQEPPLPLYLQSAWNLSSERVGIIFLALSLPMLFSSPIFGWLTDIVGAEWTAPGCMLLAVPWWGIITIDVSLAVFGVAFALESFFTSGAISPLTTELAVVSRNIEGIGYAHVYAAFNVAYGIGTTTGPIVGGQMYDHLQKGWFAICILGAALLFVSLLLAVAFTGEKPLLERLRGAARRSASSSGSQEPNA